ncbi:MAG: chemoreceptor glutamine deamidase CheD [Pseudomonadota bacterium]|nr:chemoreceptor glutamine deamidase CheD [Pseudomonadota bacterium]
MQRFTPGNSRWLPAALPGFAHINRYWDRSRDRFAAKILPGEYYVTRNAELIATVLGSCISACIRCRSTAIGGMNHFMLPQGRADGDGTWADTAVNAATRYGNYAMEHMINDLLKNGASRKYLEVKIVGGGRVLKQMSDVGEQNIEFVRAYLQAEGLTVSAEDVGDIYPRKVYYDPRSGKVSVKKLRSLHNDTIFERENQYRSHIEIAPVGGDVELFYGAIR